jgi:beta-glucosidase
LPVDVLAPHKQVDARNPASASTRLQGAVEGHVLVKNLQKALPLKSPKHISIYGYDAKNPDAVMPTSNAYSTWALGYTAFNFSAIINNLLGVPNPQVIPQIGVGGTLYRYFSIPSHAKNATILIHE